MFTASRLRSESCESYLRYEERSRAGNVFDHIKWREHFGVVETLSFPDKLRSIGDTHSIVQIPASLNGGSYSVNKIMTVVSNKACFIPISLTLEPRDVSEGRLFRQGSITNESVGAPYWCVFSREKANSPVDRQNSPSLLEAVTFFTAVIKDKEVMVSSSPFLCKDRIFLNGEEKRVCVAVEENAMKVSLCDIFHAPLRTYDVKRYSSSYGALEVIGDDYVLVNDLEEGGDR